MIYVAIVGTFAMSLIFFILGRTDPSAYFFFFDVVAFIIMSTLIVSILVRLKKSGCWDYFEKEKRNKSLLEFLYRDGSKRTTLGKRIVGMGLFQVLGLGIVLDIGRLPAPGSVYFHGDKPIRFVLQDINHTPNPKFAGYYRFLTDLGFNRIEEVQDVINGYNPELMAKVWNRLVDWKQQTSPDRVIKNIKAMNKEEMEKADKQWKNEKKITKYEEKEPKVSISDKINKALDERRKRKQ